MPRSERRWRRRSGGRDAVVDGELCALDDDGRASFSLMQQGEGTRVLYAFDLLELDGEALCDRPLSERRELLYERARPRATRCTSRAGSTTGRACSSSRARTGSRASSRSGARATYTPDKRPGTLGQGQDRQRGDVPDRGVHARPGTARERPGSPRAGRARPGGARLGRQRRHGADGRGDRPAGRRC